MVIICSFSLFFSPAVPPSFGGDGGGFLWYAFQYRVPQQDFQQEAEHAGEQKHAVDTKVIIPKFRVGDVIHLKDSCVEYTIKSISDGHYYGNGFSFNIVGCDRDYELVEHNPSWSEEDEKMLGKCINAASGYYSSEDKPNMKDWLRAIKGRILPQPLHAYSEEDEKALDSMLNDIKQGAIPDNDCINWLKTFKERVQLQPQPKQEWSDEDEKARLTTEFVLMKNFGVGTPLVDWLRNLKERATV